jgi:hypothetical protein
VNRSQGGIIVFSGNRALQALQYIQTSHDWFRMQVCTCVNEDFSFIYCFLLQSCNVLINPSALYPRNMPPVCSRALTSCKMKRFAVQRRRGPFCVELGNSWWLEDIPSTTFSEFSHLEPCRTRIFLPHRFTMGRSRRLRNRDISFRSERVITCRVLFGFSLICGCVTLLAFCQY